MQMKVNVKVKIFLLMKVFVPRISIKIRISIQYTLGIGLSQDLSVEVAREAKKSKRAVLREAIRNSRAIKFRA